MGKKNDTITPVATVVSAPASSVPKPEPVMPAAVKTETVKPEATIPVAVKTEAAPKKAILKKKPAKKPAAKRSPKLTAEEISLRAYFISEHRHKHGHHGDSHSDWVEAERQLKAERRKAKK